MDTLCLGSGRSLKCGSGNDWRRGISEEKARFRCENARKFLSSRFVVRCAGKGSKTAGPRGFGSKAPTKTVLDAGVLLKRSEQRYDQLLEEFALFGKIREFVVCVRQKENGATKKLDDWLPVAELALVSELDASEVLPDAIRILCKEVAECGAKASASFRQIPRASLEYAYEPASEFYDTVLGSCYKARDSEPKSEDGCPYEVLGLQRNSSASQVRMAYRTLAAKHHPDRNPGITDDDQFKKIVNAYERIRQTGFTVSKDYGYAGIGGNKRQGFSMPVTIDSVNVSRELPWDTHVAVRQINPDIISIFSMRSRTTS